MNEKEMWVVPATVARFRDVVLFLPLFRCCNCYCCYCSHSIHEIAVDYDYDYDYDSIRIDWYSMVDDEDC